MEMSTTHITGRVTSILAPSRFLLNVEDEQTHLKREIMVRLSRSFYPTADHSLSAGIGRLRLEKMLVGKEVHCEIVQTLSNEELIANVSVHQSHKGPFVL